MTGKVWLVGAGPGDIGLLTLRGKQVLERSEVVVYDALVGESILSLIPERAQCIFAGKRAGHHYLSQEETNRVLLEKALEGRQVVRLKGGDPFLFGRGGEELELLAENGIPFEIVPGVTSAFAVPAYNGIPVTHRDCCSSVHVVTGHRRAAQSYDIDFQALVRTGGTLVFLMGLAAMEDICRGLLAAGMDPDMPAAVLQQGTTAGQRRVIATLSTLQEKSANAAIKPPAILLVGRVCTLAERFGWYEKRPLAGVRVLVTRPRESASALSALLRERGAEVLEHPAIATRPLEDGALETHLRLLTEGKYDWLVFTSPAGVRIFFEALMEISDVRCLGKIRTAAIGQGTEKALRQYGLRADFVPSVYDARTLGRELASVCAPGDRLLIPRAAQGSPELLEGLRSGNGLRLTDLPTYETVAIPPRCIDLRGALEGGALDLAIFTSASTVRAFVGSVGDMDYQKVRAVCIGGQTRAAAEAYGMQTWTAEKATLEALADCAERAAREIKEQGEKQI